MAEENTNRKPKATLIKHKRTQDRPDHANDETKDTSASTGEKKKVVVVKKKKVVVKRPVVHQPASKGSAPAAGEHQVRWSGGEVQQHSEPRKEQPPTPPAGPNIVRPAARPRPEPQEERPRPDTERGGERPEPRSGREREERPSSADQPRDGQRSGGFRQNDSRSGGYRNDSQRPAGGYRNDQRSGGYRNDAGSRPAGGYRNDADSRPAGGYRNDAGSRPAGGYRNDAGSRPAGGYRNDAGSRPAGGYRNDAGSRPTGGYRNDAGSRPTGGYNNRPGGQRPSGGFNNRPGGSQDRRPQGGGFRPGSRPAPGGGRKPFGNAPSPVDEAASGQKTAKKVFKAKSKKKDYQKTKRDAVQERDFQIKKKTIKRANPVPKRIDIMEVITVSELARKMNLKASELIGKLMQMGMMVTINQQIDADTATLIANEYDCEVKIVSLYDETVIETSGDEESDKKHRPPIVTVMGHVDHGKTKLLDAIRETDVVAGEFGGITQHIGAYSVMTDHGNVVFLDTPGHSAFTLMRARGAQVTDIVVLVVAANDGVMPQTIEAIHHAKEAKVPIIVAINKIDLPEANPDRVKQQLAEYDLLSEDWGGSTLFCELSALKRQGISELVETILLQAEMLELDADYECRAEGKIIESKVDHGRGIVSTVIIQKGTLHVGDPFVAGVYPGKVRAMFDDKGNKIEEATPATPVEILGFTGIPSAGAPFQCTDNDKQARQVGAKRQELERLGEAQNVKKITLDNLFDSIQDGAVQELKVIIKGDVHGSVEALQSALEKLSTSEIRLQVIHASAGAIIENDINLAVASNAIVIGFNVRPTPKAQLLADREKIDIRKYNIIYDVVDDIKQAMEGMLSPELKEEVIGKVEVRDTFKVPKIGLIAGCYVLEGKVKRNAVVHIIRDDIDIYKGKISSLKRFKDDAKEVAAGYECGIGVDSYQDIQVGDILEIIQIVEVAKKLS